MLNCEADIAELLRTLVDVESVSGGEGPLADMVHTSLTAYSHLEVIRLGNVVVARTAFGSARRVIIAGHLDTVPVAGNLPGRVEIVDGQETLFGRGSVDMKGGVAVQLSLAASLTRTDTDITWIFYDNEEVEDVKNGLGHLAVRRPDILKADMAILMEPSDSLIEAGCQGTLRVGLHTQGVAAHSARSWLGHNAIHDMAGALSILNGYEGTQVPIDSLIYREGLNAVGVSGGVAGNVIPDRCDLIVNYRFAPDKDLAQAEQVVRQIFAGYEMDILDGAESASPGLTSVPVSSLVRAVGQVRPKYGWTDVARFAKLGIPAVNFGPGDPNLAHTDHEHIILDDVMRCREILAGWLTTPGSW
ncbi:MAG: succinyl-diaminopimelate desuccinylase [Propionibacteriaceae bacterium]|nr:succinyl-diaminopimelate desuccinylase [Propionibacteriaceae bacterium]